MDDQRCTAAETPQGERRGARGESRRRRIVACLTFTSVLAVAAGILVTWSHASLGNTTREFGPAADSGKATETVVGLGDSVPSGSDCDCTDYVSLLGQRIQSATGRHVTVHNDAVDGE